MIFDKLENLRRYDIVSDRILEFLFNLDKNKPLGKYPLDDGAYANIEEYETKCPENCYFEAHKKYIDIQLLIKGEERLDFTNIEGLTEREDYDDERDIVFYTDKKESGSVKLGKDYFAMLFPQDAHRPQMNSGSEPQKVKKVVVKIPVE